MPSVHLTPAKPNWITRFFSFIRRYVVCIFCICSICVPFSMGYSSYVLASFYFIFVMFFLDFALCHCMFTLCQFFFFIFRAHSQSHFLGVMCGVIDAKCFVSYLVSVCTYVFIYSIEIGWRMQCTYNQQTNKTNIMLYNDQH